jgi:hypothetical protein
MTREEVVKKFPIGLKFKVISSGEIKTVGAYGTGLMGVLIKEYEHDIMGFNTYEIEPVIEKTGLRMYFFVMGNLSGRQQGIQAGHAALEYANGYGDTNEYKNFIKNHKTFILLDGGGSNDMADRNYELQCFGISTAIFNEPDLNNSLSAIAFIVPETVYGIDLDSENEYPARDLKLAMYLKKFRLASN